MLQENNTMLYVIAGTYRQAASLATQHGLPQNRLRFIDSPEKLRGIDGAGKTLFVYGSLHYDKNYYDCIDLAMERGFKIEHI